MINFETLYAEFENDQETVKMILMVYLEQYNGCEKKIADLVETKQWKELYMLAHSFKGLLLGFGEDELTAILAEIEKVTRDDNPPSEELIQSLLDNIPKINQEIESHMESI